MNILSYHSGEYIIEKYFDQLLTKLIKKLTVNGSNT